MVTTKSTRKIFLVIGIVVVLGAFISAISWFISKNTFIYSNLVDNESKLKAQSLLSEHDISQDNIDLFLHLVDEFNSVPYDNIVKTGWKKALIPFFSYDDKDGAAHIEEQSDILTNCRMNAFILMKDSIDFLDTKIIPMDSKDPKSRNRLSNADDLLHYDLLFSSVNSEDIISSTRLAEKIVEYWNNAGIVFSDNIIQLITIYGASNNKIQNLHTAVAIYDDNRVWLLEKIDPMHPYQFSCFSSQEQMISYLQKRTSDNKYAVIFANDTCLWTK